MDLFLRLLLQIAIYLCCVFESETRATVKSLEKDANWPGLKAAWPLDME